jgi:hypothetical protein
MRTLTTEEVTALCQIAHESTNWETWDGSYPLPGCRYLQYETNPIVVKFDEVVESELISEFKPCLNVENFLLSQEQIIDLQDRGYQVTNGEGYFNIKQL